MLVLFNLEFGAAGGDGAVRTPTVKGTGTHGHNMTPASSSCAIAAPREVIVDGGPFNASVSRGRKEKVLNPATTRTKVLASYPKMKLVVMPLAARDVLAPKQVDLDNGHMQPQGTTVPTPHTSMRGSWGIMTAFFHDRARSC